ncbi:MAG TPA: MFS transporter [Sporichthyaceae bacterium]|nr:MFS transporter [Sporichthyaceae bacterium]
MHGRFTMLRRVAAAGLIGSTIEWFDFFLYAMMSALVFDHVFFPKLNSTAGSLASFATFGAGFVARPVGSLLMGHFGDRVGRKSALVVSLVVMGTSTFAIGLLPGYNSIGVAAPAILTALRLLQGLSLGGEWSGAVTLAMEHAPDRKRGWWAAWAQFGAMGGIMLSSGTVLLLSENLTNRQFMDWGWRIPFLASGVLLLVGLFVRLRVAESPVFQEISTEGTQVTVPVAEAVRRHSLSMLRAGGMHLMVAGFATTLLTFYIPYGVKHVHFSRTDMLKVVFLATVVTCLLSPFLAGLSDRFGRRTVYVVGTTLGGIGAFTSFLLLDVGTVPVAVIGILCLVLPVAATFQVQGAWFPELFPPAARVTGSGFGSQMATVLVGGPAPFVATALLDRGHGRPWWVASYLCLLAVASTIAALLTPDTRPARASAPAPIPAGGTRAQHARQAEVARVRV